MLKLRSSPKFTQSGLLIFLTKEQLQKGAGFSEWPKEVSKAVTALRDSGHFQAGAKELFPLSLGKQLVLLAGLGETSGLTPAGVRTAVRQAVLSGFLKTVKDLEILPHAPDADMNAFVDGVLIGTYSWNKYRSDKPETASGFLKDLYLVTTDKKAFEAAQTVCQGVNLARDLVNDNADVVTAECVEQVIKDTVKDRSDITLTVLNRKELKSKGLNLHLAVNQGSAKEPKLIIVQYSGGGKSAPYTALVGKGITFDTGGLNLKPTGSIETMRTDMSGAAAVVGTLRNTLALGLKKNVLFVCALAENAIGSGSYKPGDVITGYAGKSVEIGNTDAEGRLVLADALAYVIKNYRPAQVIDIATLTGACVIALGNDYSGLVSTYDPLADALLRVARETDDRIWRLPTYPELQEYIKSPSADIKNVGLPRGAAGTLTAAEFLRQFTDGLPWAHLDIAGTAYTDKGRSYYGHGATGAGVRLLTGYLQGR